jgi:hypothetical protein
VNQGIVKKAGMDAGKRVTGSGFETETLPQNLSPRLPSGRLYQCCFSVDRFKWRAQTPVVSCAALSARICGEEDSGYATPEQGYRLYIFSVLGWN